MGEPLKIAIAGLGTVGGGVIKALAAQAADLKARAGRDLAVVGMSARDADKARGFKVFHFTADPLTLVKSDADVIVELIGGENGIAKQLIETALDHGKHVVTANKALLATHGKALAERAEKRNLQLKFEAAVAGGIPIVQTLRESLIAYDVQAVKGILNGTCNYILTQMEALGAPFGHVLK
ncbi:MAG TPA: homoserine dehydrogenase, partial [Rhizomicrobium sp.]|nr:homoserine dehydrogenase [Rhizomicrobium sp.]